MSSPATPRPSLPALTPTRKRLLFRAGAGEAVLEAKVGGGDIIAVLSGFLLAISLGELRPGPA